MATIRKRNGNLYIDYYDEAGKRHRKALHLSNTRENYTKALLEKKKIEYELGAGVYKERVKRISYRNKTIREGFDEFLISKSKRKEKTIKHYKNAFDKIYNLFGEIKIQSVTVQMIEDLENEMRKTLALNSIASYFNKLKQIFKYFVEEGYIELNPVPKKKMKPKEIVIIPEKQLQEILSLLRIRNNEQYKFIFFLLATGLRSGELIRLDWRDVDLKKSIIAVRNYKSDRIDLLPIYVELREFILHEFPEREGKIFNYSSPDSLRFFKRFLEREGFPHYSIHTLRKTYISRLVNSGLSVYDVMTLARHRNIQTTLKHYTEAELSRIGKEVSQRANMGAFLGTKIKHPLKVVNTS